MLVWAAYLSVISAIMSVAALTLERAIRPYGFATRWIWVCALFGSLALPIALAATRSGADAADAAGPAGAGIHLLLGGGSRIAAVAGHYGSRTQLPVGLLRFSPARVDALLEAFWAVSSGIAGAVLFGGCCYARRRRRHWRWASIAGTELLVAQDAGPATVGFFRPRIVLPEWLLTAAPETLGLIIAHERSHVAARDPGVLGLGWGIAALMPWNPFVWWQVYRLRLAIEVDCDRRVLRAGHDVRRYAGTLVDVSTRRSAFVAGLAASSRSFSSIEQRIIIMSTPRIHGWQSSAAACTLLSLGIATVATLISPPAIPPALAGIADAGQNGLGRYVGSYETSTITVVRVGLDNGQLVATFPGMKPQLLSRKSGEQFRLGRYDAYLRFALDASGHVTGLVLQQNGAATEAPRIAADRVHAITSAIDARVRDQAAAPGSEAALRELILGIDSGNPDYDDLSPQLAAGTRAMLSNMQTTMKALGAIRSIQFRGVDSKGWDQYLVRFERGSASWGIVLDSYGLVVGAMVHPAS